MFKKSLIFLLNVKYPGHQSDKSFAPRAKKWNVLYLCQIPSDRGGIQYQKWTTPWTILW